MAYPQKFEKTVVLIFVQRGIPVKKLNMAMLTHVLIADFFKRHLRFWMQSTGGSQSHGTEWRTEPSDSAYSYRKRK